MVPIADLIVNPKDDLTFVEKVRALMVAHDGSAEALQVSLREHYPLAVVRARNLSGEANRMWYVYRDGRWIPT